MNKLCSPAVSLKTLSDARRINDQAVLSDIHRSQSRRGGAHPPFIGIPAGGIDNRQFDGCTLTVHFG